MIKNKKILITGAGGQLAKEFISYLKQRNMRFVALTKTQMNITDYDRVNEVINKEKPDILINCAAYNLVDQAEDDSEIAFRVNGEAVKHLASTCSQNDIFLVHFSSDFVFDGHKNKPYIEEDLTNPLNVYGQSKLNGEKGIYQELDKYLVFRVSWVFGNGKQNFLYKLSQWIKDKTELRIVDDQYSVPTYTEDIVNTVIIALEKGLSGIYHLTNEGQCSRYEWAKYYAELNKSPINIIPVKSDSFKSSVNRPLWTCMSNELISKRLNILIPTWQEAVKRFVNK